MARKADSPADALARTREAALQASQGKGQESIRRALEGAATDLRRRLAGKGGSEGFTARRMQQTLLQIKDTTRALNGEIQTAVVGNVESAAGAATDNLLRYMRDSEKHYRGISQPLPIREAELFDRAVSGARASVLRRLATGERDDAQPPKLTAKEKKMGEVLRYIRDAADDRELTPGYAFARASTKDVAEALGMSNDEAYALLNTAAKKKLLSKGDRAGSGRREGAVAHRNWEMDLDDPPAIPGEADYNPELAPVEPALARMGILQRYGVETIGTFEELLQRGLLARTSWGEVRDSLVEASPFLQGQPSYWAERIMRTETMGGYNRAGWEATRAADDELGDMVKILCATFDERTGWDSYQVHGQIRLPDQAFEWAEGSYQHPPNRPNDREVVVPHRIAWPIPPNLAPVGDDLVATVYSRQRKTGGPGPRPLMTTVDLSRFGRG